ncbi:SRPBCC family protein [Mycobacterium sp. CBMA271]|uniref:SRPBCC family protein n=1 Tax=unclassified Mycobacteroides TaxID=2618759 RepID=UPI0012DF1537|nr:MULTISPECIES: SRPBCC family protein [unclassified Mycobacteroides]MUM15859.1 cyclase [Mycobacteroides sp. CBMA 326]MUM24470.1 SRPBCC family protein [Mycobacteroides sp. CBMA 271]
MATSDTREVVIEATPEQIMDVIADFDVLPKWSLAHQSSTVVSTHDDGRPHEVKMKIKAAGIADEQVVAYSWGPDAVSWTLLKAGQLRSQDGKYTFTPKGDKTHVKFELSVDLLIPLPGFILKRTIKGAMETATDGLRKQVLATYR